jgi:hypothetical protein
MDPHHIGKLDQDPHHSEKLDPHLDPHQSEKQDSVEAHMQLTL